MSDLDNGSCTARKSFSGRTGDRYHTLSEPEILTRGKLLVRRSAEEVQIPEKSGYLGVLHGSRTQITELEIGRSLIGGMDGRTLLRSRTVSLKFGPAV